MMPIAPALTGSYPLRPGNRVRPLIDGEPAFRRICEAVEAARRRVWVTVAFVDHDAQMPDGRGTAFDVLDRAAARGLDVRVLFWREPELPSLLPDSEHFAGTVEERDWLRERGARFRARWDHLPHYCHHQKSWVLDAGEAGEVAFVGGINLDRGSIVRPGHSPRTGEASVHDLYVEVAGPASTDVGHNFVQRWNEASERDRPDGAWPNADVAGPLPFPSRLAPPAGDVPVQVARTIRRGIYAARVASPEAAAFGVADGESSILEQYLAAIDGARHGIYIENQFLGSPAILERLARAVARGVEVVFVLPGVPMDAVRDTRARGGRATLFFDALAALGERPNFTLAALSSSDARGVLHDVYVHAKMMLVDDAWATVGSANLLQRSFHADTELNASFWHPATVRALRIDLLAEHLALDTSEIDLATGLRTFADRARANRTARARGAPMRGLAWALEPARYGLEQCSG
jgi:cardiolipin synthase